MVRAPLLLAVLIVLWLPSGLLGEDTVPPLLVIAPIIWASLNRGLRWGIPVAVLASVLAGPLTPTAHGASQELTVMLVRGAIFLFIAAALGLEHERERRRLREQVLTDPLTGLPTSAVLDAHLALTLAQSRRAGEAVAVVSVDIDDFAAVNEGLGHARADALLREVAMRMAGEVRAGDLLARHAGDEFVLVITRLDATNPGDAALRAVDRVLAALDVPVGAPGAELALQATAGISLFPRDGEEGGTLRRRAGTALRRAKATDVRRLLYEEGPENELHSRTMAARLRRAVADGELEVHYQPIWSLPDGTVSGVEALVRWRDPERGLVPPDSFIRVAEETGVIHALGSWVMHETCRQAALWMAEGLHPRLGVNLSPHQLARSGVVDDLVEAVQSVGLPPERVILEITESAWSMDDQRTAPALQALRDHGFRLAMDDFGAGHSSLGRLADLPVAVLKIDRALLNGVPERADAVAVLTAAVALAEAVGCDVVAEGIETREQLDQLCALGVPLGQGYLMARPGQAADVTQILREHLEPRRRTRPAITRA
jgi:diguanylate cyclase (GGDEF)-like protein